MAIKLEDKVNVEAPSASYPYGNIKDNTGAGDGTPVNKATMADYIQFFAKLLHESAIVANGLPENADNGFQYYTALQTIVNALIVAAGKLSKAGDAMTGELAMGSNKITGLFAGGDPADAVNRAQLDTKVDIRLAAFSDFDTLTNAITTTFFYGSSFGPVNGPGANFDKYYTLIVSKGTGGISQLMIGIDVVKIYTRRSDDDGDTWSAWTTIL